MGVKDSRKLIKLNKSLATVLPIGWTRYWGMKDGDRISIFYDSVLVMIPPNHPRKMEIEKKLRKFLL